MKTLSNMITLSGLSLILSLSLGGCELGADEEDFFEDENGDYLDVHPEDDGISASGALQCWLSHSARRTGKETTSSREYKITWRYDCSGVPTGDNSHSDVQGVNQYLEDYGTSKGGSSRVYKWENRRDQCGTHGVCFSVRGYIRKGSCRTFNRYLHAGLWVPEVGWFDLVGNANGGSNKSRRQCTKP